MDELIDINCYEINDLEFKEPTNITLPVLDLKENIYKENDSHFIKYYHYKIKDYKLSDKTQGIMRIKLEEYKRLKKLI